MIRHLAAVLAKARRGRPFEMKARARKTADANRQAGIRAPCSQGRQKALRLNRVPKIRRQITAARKNAICVEAPLRCSDRLHLPSLSNRVCIVRMSFAIFGFPEGTMDN
jgi:hypothetical protein